jgi:hypothetical protein
MDPITIAMSLAQFVPAIVKWVSGSDKAEDAATAVVDIARKVTGQGDGEAALKDIQANPGMVLQFRMAVMDKEADLDKAYLVDRQDARARDVEYVKAARYNWRADVLSILAVGGLVLCVWFIARDAGLPERAVNAIMFVAGVLASAVRDVYGFEFGSSRSSQVKDATISNLSK